MYLDRGVLVRKVIVRPAGLVIGGRVVKMPKSKVSYRNFSQYTAIKWIIKYERVPVGPL